MLTEAQIGALLVAWREYDHEALLRIAPGNVTLSALAASTAGRYDDALNYYAEAADDEPLLVILKEIDAEYCRTKGKRRSDRIAVRARLQTTSHLINQFKGCTRLMIVHHQLYSWYIAAFWYSQAQALFAGALLLLLSLVLRYREGVVHGTFLLGHSLNVFGWDRPGVPLVRRAFDLRDAIGPWKRSAFHSYMGYGLYVVGREPELTKVILTSAMQVLEAHPDPFYRTLLQVTRLRNASQIGDVEEAEIVADDLVGRADQGANARFRMGAYADLAVSYGMRGLYWKSDELLASIAHFAPDEADPIEAGTFFRLRGWANLFTGNHRQALADGQAALKCLAQVKSFALARRMSRILCENARYRLELDPEADRSPSRALFATAAHLARLRMMQLRWRRNHLVVQVVTAEREFVRDSIRRINGLTNAHSRHVGLLQQELFAQLDDIVNAPSDDGAWSIIAGALDRHFGVSTAGIVMAERSGMTPVRTQASAARMIEIALPRLISGAPHTQIVSLAIGDGKHPQTVADALLTLTPTLACLLRIRDLKREAVRGAEAITVARTTQMLAHDVRKPFSILRMGLQMLGRAKSLSEAQHVIARLTPEVDRALTSVNGLIQDVMEIGATPAAAAPDLVSPITLIETALTEIFRIYPRADVALRYDFAHQHQLRVDQLKIGRALSNILANAVEAIGAIGAIGAKGVVWFRTKEANGAIEIAVGNTGSYIPPEDLQQLFEVFFTRRKRCGTGLGLAIAHKMITAHGGRIWCTSVQNASYPSGMVEFSFTLPSAPDAVDACRSFPPSQSSGILAASAGRQVDAPRAPAAADASESVLEADLLTAIRRLRRPARILVVDDEAVYRAALRAHLVDRPDVAAALTIVEAADGATALQSAASHDFDLVISDIDLGARSMTGFELVRMLRQTPRFTAFVCMHSNRMNPPDYKEAVDSGADSFIPKPAARPQIMKLILQAVLTAGALSTSEASPLDREAHADLGRAQPSSS